MSQGGVLSKRVDAFMLFPTIEQNDAFFELLNYADSSKGSFPEGDRMLENLHAYSKVSMAKRAGKVDPLSLDAEECAKWIKR